MNSEHPVDVKQRYVETATKAFVKSMESASISMNKIFKEIGDEWMSNKDFNDTTIPYIYLSKELNICMKCGEDKDKFFGLIKTKCKCNRWWMNENRFKNN